MKKGISYTIIITFVLILIVLVIAVGTVTSLNAGGNVNDFMTDVLEIDDSACRDSDIGIDYFLKGTTTLEDGTFQADFCDINTGKLSEYYCANGFIRRIRYNCPLGCETDNNGNTIAECIDGVETINNCEDGDGGLNYFKESKTSKTASGVSRDSCSISNGGDPVPYSAAFVVEYYCTVGGSIRKKYYECPYGCDCKDDYGAVFGEKICACKISPHGTW